MSLSRMVGEKTAVGQGKNISLGTVLTEATVPITDNTSRAFANDMFAQAFGMKQAQARYRKFRSYECVSLPGRIVEAAERKAPILIPGIEDFAASRHEDSLSWAVEAEDFYAIGLVGKSAFELYLVDKATNPVIEPQKESSLLEKVTARLEGTSVTYEFRSKRSLVTSELKLPLQFKHAALINNPEDMKSHLKAHAEDILSYLQDESVDILSYQVNKGGKVLRRHIFEVRNQHFPRYVLVNVRNQDTGQIFEREFTPLSEFYEYPQHRQGMILDLVRNRWEEQHGSTLELLGYTLVGPDHDPSYHKVDLRLSLVEDQAVEEECELSM